MKHVRPLYLPPTYQDAPDHGRLILRDGSTATIRLSRPEDLEDVKAFYARLSAQSRRMRFFSERKPGEDVLASLCDSSNPQKAMSLLVWRIIDDSPRIVATGSYISDGPPAAEFAVAVDDAFQGKGLGGLLLERLSVLAASHGFTRFNAFTHTSNHHMLETFRHSGFTLREAFQDGMVEVQFSVTPGEASASHALHRDRLFTKASLRPFFYPQSIAVIGASRDPNRLGHQLFTTILRHHFRGVVYPVNPQASQVSGVKAYPTAEDLPEAVDLAVLAVPRDEVLTTISQCARRGVRTVIVFSSGFAEAGEEGRALQQQLLDLVRGYGMRMLGPNCLGLINTDPDIQLNASMSAIVPPRGRVAISSQSGALGMALLALAQKRNLGISSFVSMGNKADVTGNDLLHYWEDDPSTNTILLYLESFGNPRRFGRIAREVSHRKPIVCVKSGHRGALDEAAIDALFRQSGVIRMSTLEDMFDVAALLGTQPLPAGPRFAIITNSRGAGILGRDAGEDAGLICSSFIDLSASANPDDYANAMHSTNVSSSADALVIIYMPVTITDVSPWLEAIARSTLSSKPVLLVMMTSEATNTILSLACGPVPCYLFPEAACRALASAARYRAWRDTPTGMIPDFDDIDWSQARAIIQHAGTGEVSAADAASLLAATGIRPASPLASIMDVALEVQLDPLFGPVMTFGLAGDHREMPGENSCRMVPLSDVDASSMIESIRAFPLLAASGAHIETLQEILLRVSLLIEELPEIEKLRLAPIGLADKPGLFQIGQTLIRISERA